MAKNILIFSDGTGQVGGLRPDERRSNIYKLFRATRCVCCAAACSALPRERFSRVLGMFSSLEVQVLYPT